MKTANCKDIQKVDEYYYCQHCRRIRSSDELAIRISGMTCRICGSTEIDEPAWVVCPYNKLSAVKCPRAGKGIINGSHGYECLDRCFFRV